MRLRCKLPTEDLDVLVSINCDENLANVIEEYDRVSALTNKEMKIRALLSPINLPKKISRPSSPMSCFDFLESNLKPGKVLDRFNLPPSYAVARGLSSPAFGYPVEEFYYPCFVPLFVIGAAAAALLVGAVLIVLAVRTTVITWIKVFVLLAFVGKRRRGIVKEGKKITSEVAMYAANVVFKESGLFAFTSTAIILGQVWRDTEAIQYSELTLTYIDEDGDVVTLVDDEDLQDIMRQDLNPLRISVRLNTEKIRRSSGTSSGNSTPFRSTMIQPTFPNINSSVSDFIKSLPESKSGKIACPVSGVTTGVIDSAGAFLHETASQAFPSVKSGEPSPAAANAEERTFKTAGQPKNHTGSIDASKLKYFQPGQNATQCKSLSRSPKPNSSLVDGKKEEGKKFGDSHLVGKALGISYSGASTTGPEKRADKQPSENHTGAEPVGAVGSHNPSDGTAAIFRGSVLCDGCGVHPITGPRKEDYDLCSLCFAQNGNDADYIRMDRPVTYHHPVALKGLHDPRDNFRGCGVKSPKLDSRFTQDVNVFDGTIMAPLIPFTKVWRMRNNGNIVWSQGTQLVWIGGDRFSDAFSVELQITSVGLAVDHELDVAVDFTAPKLPGRYISYWRMALPSGQKFGQRVWVLIQVDASMNLPKKELIYEASQDLNLNFPPASNGVDGSETINANADTTTTTEDIIPDPKISNPIMELVEPVLDGNRNKEEESTSCMWSSAAGSSILFPIDLNEAAPADTSAAPPSVTEVKVSSQDGGENSDVEMTLLKELEEMGRWVECIQTLR
ncbi:hypothetical protein RND71_010284 [Anisodus tanguticus]|uniref:PB1 domain-containing protein n=1 Tax=Anisodus tanguticus TaxID=243964 RepID=A0AAE1VS06_9SOLA|nr:hypothetical protein RND71_010284 [Anisodus tanguticus]